MASGGQRLSSSSTVGRMTSAAPGLTINANSKDKPSTGTATSIREILPKRGYLHCEDELTFVLCKPKLLPLKSFTMEKLEKIQADSVEKAKEMMENSQLD